MKHLNLNDRDCYLRILLVTFRGENSAVFLSQLTRLLLMNNLREGLREALTCMLSPELPAQSRQTKNTIDTRPA